MPSPSALRQLRSLRRNEWGIALILGYVTLVVVPLILMLVVVGAKFKPQGLLDPGSLDRAQLARHLADGHGYITSVIRPLSVGFHAADPQAHPDLYNPPLHPLLLAAFFKVAGATDLAVAGFGAMLWVLSVWLTFFLARKWFGLRTAWLAAALYTLNVTALTAALQGSSQPLIVLLVLGAAWLLLPGRADEPDPDPIVPAPVAAPAPRRFRPARVIEAEFGPERVEQLDTRADATGGTPNAPGDHPEPPAASTADEERAAIDEWRALPLWRLAAAGLLWGLACVTHYLMLLPALGFAYFVFHNQHARGRALGAFLAGMVGPLGLWWARNWVVGGSPFFSLYWYEALTNSFGFPGESIWHYTATPAHPLLYPLQHPFQTLSKILTGLIGFRQDLVTVLDPVVLFIFAAALVFGLGNRCWRAFSVSLAVAALLLMLGSSFLRAETGLLLIWAPLLCIGTGFVVSTWATAQLGHIRLRFGRRRLGPAWTQGLAGAALVATVALPAAYFILVARPPQPLDLKAQLAPVRDRVSADGTVLTDQPALVAWHTGRASIWLPQREEDLASMEATFKNVEGAYITGALSTIPMRERGAWWFWLSRPEGRFRGLTPAVTTSAGLLWLRQRQAMRSR